MKITTLLFLVLTVKIASAALVYSPTNLRKTDAKLVVVIHGCVQSAESMAFGAGWNQLADKNNFVVLYPQVPDGSNPLGCWNWFLPENQRADSGQLKMVMDQIRETKRVHKIGGSAVYVTGISSGAATAAGLLACFPGEFKAGALHSGPPYASAQTPADSIKVLSEGPPAQMPPAACKPRDFRGAVMVVHGSVDDTVKPPQAHTVRIISEFLGNTNALATQDLTAGGVPYSVSDYASNNGAVGRLVMIKGLSHAWSGFAEDLRHKELLKNLGPKGLTAVPFFAPLGPSATQLIWEFFTSARAPNGSKKKNQEH